MMTLYETDFYAWTQRQAALLRQEEFAEVDWNHLIEEIESLGRSEKHEVESRLIILIMHLLKWEYQPELQSRSWRNTITVQRVDLRRLLRDNPTLRAHVADFVVDLYPDALVKAIAETGLRKTTFPATCPYTATQILADEFWPEEV
ncbi:MAG: DUF29 domain-containing protein [Caldilineaceae bacterium]